MFRSAIPVGKADRLSTTIAGLIADISAIQARWASDLADHAYTEWIEPLEDRVALLRNDLKIWQAEARKRGDRIAELEAERDDLAEELDNLRSALRDRWSSVFPKGPQ